MKSRFSYLTFFFLGKVDSFVPFLLQICSTYPFIEKISAHFCQLSCSIIFLFVWRLYSNTFLQFHLDNLFSVTSSSVRGISDDYFNCLNLCLRLATHGNQLFKLDCSSELDRVFGSLCLHFVS